MRVCEKAAARVPDLRRLPVGLVIRDTYSVVRHLGSGAFGDVYLARHRFMGLQALKVFSRNDGTDALEEAYLLTQLSHPCIVRMFEANEFSFEEEPFGYFSMEFIEGGTLLACIELGLSWSDRLSLSKDILEGLTFAHAQVPPVTHRDISPTNILVEKSINRLRAKVSDFGLAKHVDAKSLIASAAGKYLYMAPESFLGIHSTATDVYSAALVLFELFTGNHPFQVSLSMSADSTEIARVVRESRSRSIPRVGSAIDAIWDKLFQRALAHDCEDRPQTASDLLKLFCLLAEPSSKPHEGVDFEVSELVREAKRLAGQFDTLGEAIALLERACTTSVEIREQYSDLLSLWKRGILQ